MENKNVINIKNLVKQFPVGGNYFTALQNIDLKLSEGEFQRWYKLTAKLLPLLERIRNREIKIFNGRR